MLIPGSRLESSEAILSFWKDYTPELLNQKLCRMVLSVQKKASRLMMLGELGRFPILIKALASVFKYQHSLEYSSNSNTIISKVFKEMKSSLNVGEDNCLQRVDNLKKQLGISIAPYLKPELIAGKIKTKLESKFERYWLDKINEVKWVDGRDTNKCRFYKQFKACFKQEQYLTLIRNRNQRSQLTRLRTSTHSPGIERMWYLTPAVPPELRHCKYCSDPAVRAELGLGNKNPEPDTEEHFVLQCHLFTIKRNCFLGKLSSLGVNVNGSGLLYTLLCPTNIKVAKVTNKFL